MSFSLHTFFLPKPNLSFFTLSIVSLVTTNYYWFSDDLFCTGTIFRRPPLQRRRFLVTHLCLWFYLQIWKQDAYVFCSSFKRKNYVFDFVWLWFHITIWKQVEYVYNFSWSLPWCHPHVFRFPFSSFNFFYCSLLRIIIWVNESHKTSFISSKYILILIWRIYSFLIKLELKEIILGLGYEISEEEDWRGRKQTIFSF